MKKKFAFLLLGNDYDPDIHHANFETQDQITYIYTVRSFEEACQKVIQLEKDGVGAIELCGAFGQEKAKQLTELTKQQIAIGYVVHDPCLEHVFQKFFPNASNEPEKIYKLNSFDIGSMGVGIGQKDEEGRKIGDVTGRKGVLR